MNKLAFPNFLDSRDVELLKILILETLPECGEARKLDNFSQNSRDASNSRDSPAKGSFCNDPFRGSRSLLGIGCDSLA